MLIGEWIGIAAIIVPVIIAGLASYIDSRLRDNDRKHENEALKQKVDWYHEGMVELKQLIKSYKRPSDGKPNE